jgi:hypothetical protein
VSPLVIVVLVTAGDRDPQALQGLEQAVREALGSATIVQTHEVGAAPDDDELASTAATEKAAAVTRLHWVDQARREAVLRIYTSRPEAFYDRTLTFSPSDVPAERGRAMGLVIAAIFPNPQRQLERHEPPPPQISTLARPPPPPQWSAWALELAAVAVRSVGGAAGGLGGGIAARWLPTPQLALRAGVRARVGEVNEASASSRLLAATFGPSYRFTEPAATVALGVRADAVLAHESLSHFSADDRAPVRQGYFSGGVDALGELEVRLSAGAALVFSAGTEVVFTKGTVFVRGERVTQLPPLRIIGEAGVRIGF